MVSKSARRRQLARESYERYQQRRTEKQRAARRRRRIAVVGTLSVALVALLAWGTWWFFIDPDEDDFTTASDPTTTAAAGSCVFTPGGEAARPVSGVPSAEPSLGGGWTATITINGQPVTATLDAAAAPCGVASLQFLADQGYYAGTTCHRLTTGASLKVLQCGDPTGTGSGGPGYSFGTEVAPTATYPVGTLAMANAGGSNGSQFFIVYGDSPALTPDYTVLGTVTSGLEVVQGIAAAGVAGGAEDGAPAQTATVDSLNVARA